MDHPRENKRTRRRTLHCQTIFKMAGNHHKIKRNQILGNQGDAKIKHTDHDRMCFKQPSFLHIFMPDLSPKEIHHKMGFGFLHAYHTAAKQILYCKSKVVHEHQGLTKPCRMQGSNEHRVFHSVVELVTGILTNFKN